ncbi:MAG: hypothetical protein Q9160_001052, partial [Pyrenula sp. 1 TL-2023]
HLGRAKELGEFVKHGCREAIIEIELKADPKRPEARRNPVIRRTIKKDNKSNFEVYGKACGTKKVQELARSFSIQIDNLCQFLPQDKVVEFAAMTPIELLQSTLRAAAGPEMLQWHENLKDLRAEQKQLLSSNKGDRENLANLENRQQLAKVDYDNYNLLKDSRRRLGWMERCRPLPKYNTAKRLALEAKDKRKQLTLELKKLRDQVAPALKKVNEKEQYARQVKAVVHHRKNEAEAASKDVDRTRKEVDVIGQRIQEIESSMEAEAKSRKSRREDLKRTQLKISTIEKQMEQQPEDFDPSAVNDQLRELTRQGREVEQAMRNAREQAGTIRSSGEEKSRETQALENRLENLDTQSGQQENKLQAVSRDTYQAWKWVQKNQTKFRQQVFGPAIVECSLKDPKYANAIESILQQNDFLAFTVQSREDFITLQKCLVNDLRLHDISIKTCPRSGDSLKGPLPQELREFGFEGWAIDYLNGPDQVLAVLCDSKFLHRTPISSREISESQFTQMTQSSVNSWVAGNTMYRITRRREYGDSAVSTNTRALKSARFWTNQPVDQRQKTDLNNRILELKDDMQAIRDELKKMQAQNGQHKERLKDIEQEKQDLERDKNERQKALTEFRALPVKLEEQKQRLASTQESIDAIARRHGELAKEAEKEIFTKTEAAIEVVTAVSKLRELQMAALEAELLHIEAVSDVETLKERNEDITSTLKAKEAEETTAIEEAAKLTKEAQAFAGEVRQLVSEKDSTPGLSDFMESIRSDLTTDDLEAMIDSETAKIEMTHVDNSRNIVKDYEDRQKRIDQIRNRLQAFHERQSDLDHAINEIRSLWEPELDKLIKKISDAFSDSFARIGCAGEVAVYKASADDSPSQQDDLNPNRSRTIDNAETSSEPTGGNGLDFANWALHIRVQFRESEDLALLDSHRQSGGERAVSTIFYLMALQSLSRAPFRVVDEINQGMDPRNERMVHGRLVDLACGEGATGGQYFLITPKLLSNLRYTNGMKVLCIVSGEKMPSPEEVEGEVGRIDFGEWIGRARALGMGSGGRGKRIDSGAYFGDGNGNGNGLEDGVGSGVEVGA